MRQRRSTSLRRAAAWLAAAALALPAAAHGGTLVVRDGESIQDAVDAARPGDRIVVLPGTYTGDPTRDAVVTITTDDLTLKGSRRAVIDARSFRYGIVVGVPAPIGPAGCPDVTVRNFEIRGFTVRDAEDTGLLLVGVDGYRIRGGVYLDNAEYGPFPICSRNGRIDRNKASGHDDAAIYVGDDDRVVVERNRVTRSAIGIEIENSTNAIVRRNILIGNTAGVLVVVLPGLPMPFTQNVRIQRNLILHNNLPNPVPVDSGDAVGLIPTGTGILNVGGDDVVVERNVVIGNDSFGVAAIGNAFALLDSRIEPFVDGGRTRRNVVLQNGRRPDPERALGPGADIAFLPDAFDPGTGTVLLTDPDPSDNCYARNVFRSDLPDGVVASFPCH